MKNLNIVNRLRLRQYDYTSRNRIQRETDGEAEPSVRHPIETRREHASREIITPKYC